MNPSLFPQLSEVPTGSRPSPRLQTRGNFQGLQGLYARPQRMGEGMAGPGPGAGAGAGFRVENRAIDKLE